MDGRSAPMRGMLRCCFLGSTDTVSLPTTVVVTGVLVSPGEAITLFASLKVERLHGTRFQTIRQAKDETLDWLLWYNRTRLHSTLKYLSPMQFEQQWQDRTEAIAS